MIDGWELVVGIEIHAQVKSNSKLFSSSSTNFGSGPNSQVSLVDAAMPGMLPVINKFCVEQAVRSGIGLNAKINNKSIFDRKNYFYQDLPQGYQISQFKDPIVGNGFIEISSNGQSKKIGIERLHLEQDAGKSLHDQDPNYTFVDLNRSGIALMEIVSKPDISSADEAVEYVKKVRSILRYLDTCDGNMEQGSLRADVNVSVNKPGDSFGTRCEIKNLNSFKFIHSAIIYEAKRQIRLIESGESIHQETRLYNIDTGETRSMRSKEDAHDYRYFPDPDLPPLIISDEKVNLLKEKLPELPDEKKNRFMREFNLSSYDAEVIVNDKDTALFFEKLVKGRDSKVVTNWITGEVFSYLKKINKDIKNSGIAPEKIGSLIDLIVDEKISNRQAKEVFEEYMKSMDDATTFIEKKGLVQLSDQSEIYKIIDKVLSDNPKMVDDYKNGKDKLFGFFIGQVMKISKGKANPKLVNELLVKRLKE